MKEVVDNNRTISYIIHGIFIPIVGAIGFGGNVVGIGYLVFRNNRKRNHTFYLLLLTLFLFDLTFIVSTTIMFSMRELFPKLYDEPVSAATLYLDYWSFPMSCLTLFGSIYFTVAICFERYMAICTPLYYRTKRRHSVLYMFMLFSFIVIVNIPHFLEINMKEDDNGEMNLYPSSLRNNRMYYYVYGVGVKFLFQYILPYTILILLNIKIWKVPRMKKISVVSMPSEHATFQITMSSKVTKQRKIQSELVKLSLILAVMLMVCTPVGLVNDIYEVIHGIEEVSKNSITQSLHEILHCILLNM